MRRALDPGASWNQGDRPFLREGSVVAVVLVSDKVDCSVAPGGYAFFTDPIHDVFWEIDPDFDAKTDPTPAICFNSSVECSPADANGVYADCEPVDDNGVLHPLDRYGDALGEQLGRGVVMLAMVGVPEVTSHDPAPPFHPLVGGVLDLVVRRWNDQAWPAGDLLPGDPESGPKKEWRWGIGPACTGLDGVGGFTGQALPSLRMNAVCQSLDRGPDPQDLRCIIESVCDTDPTQALWSLAGLVQNAVHDP
jgi:hypothetical protein